MYNYCNLNMHFYFNIAFVMLLSSFYIWLATQKNPTEHSNGMHITELVYSHIFAVRIDL